MSDFSIMIVEDEEIFADRLEILVEQLGYRHLCTVASSTAALAQMFTKAPDLILMDINIEGELDGIELAQKINEGKPTPIIFITSYRDEGTFRRALQKAPVAFLLKPFDELQLQRSIELAVLQLSKDRTANEVKKEWVEDVFVDDFIFIKVRNRLVKVYVPNIYFVEADGQYSTLHTSERKFVVRMGLNELLQKFPKNLFIQTHRSYFVNLEKVEQIDLSDGVLHVGTHHVPVSRRFKEVLIKRLPSL